MQEIMKLTALQLGAAIRRGEVSPTEAVKARHLTQTMQHTKI